jgi:serine/threonine protein kinase/tetratricopeptide (TPR) repeat protein
MIGSIVSHYKILGKLGEGGMGVVYKAKDIKLERIVALKFLPPHLSNQEAEKKRFIQEAKAASSLEHNNICTVYEISETADGQLFIAMSYLEGVTLREKIDGAPLKIDEAINIAIQTAEGLKLAHGKEIVHRDIKPANIMMTSDGTVKIMDFGLAKRGDKTRLTQMGTTLGTFAYMSPEQSKGDEVDRRTDIWSLGVVLYEMLTGKLPFKGDYEQAVIYSIKNENPEPVTSLRSGIPLELERITNKLLAKNPDERYQNMTDVIVDLQNLKRKLNYELISPSINKITEEERKFPIKLISISAIIVIAAVVLFLTQPWKSSVHLIRSIAVLPLGNLSHNPDQEYFVDGMTEALITELSKIKSLTVISRTSVMQFKNTTKTIPEIASMLGVDALIEGSALLVDGRVRITTQLIDASDKHLWANDYDEDLKNVLALQKDVSRSIAKEVKIALTPTESKQLETAATVNPDAYINFIKAKHQLQIGTRESVQKGRDLLKEAINLDPDYAAAHAWLGAAYMSIANLVIPLNDRLERKKLKEMALEEIEAALKLDDSSSDAHWIKGNYELLQNWNIKTAEGEYKRALDLNPGDATAYIAYADLLGILGKYDEALKLTRHAQELDPLSVYPLLLSANVYDMLARFDDSIIQEKKAIELDGTNVHSWMKLGNTYYFKGKKKEALNSWAKAHEIEGNKKLAKAYRELPFEQAIQTWLDQATDFTSDSIHTPIFSSNSFNLALVYYIIGNKQESLKWLNKAIEERDSNLIFFFDTILAKPLWTDPMFDDAVKRIKTLINYPNTA